MWPWRPPREMPIVRGAVLERSGGQRPACLAPPPKKKPRYYRDQVFRWNDDRERAVRAMKRVFDRLEEQGSVEEAKALRTQLDRIIPAFWEDDLAERGKPRPPAPMRRRGPLKNGFTRLREPAEI